jgi:hypothetical protein
MLGRFSPEDGWIFSSETFVQILLHGDISRKMKTFITAAVKASNLPEFLKNLD